MDVEPWQVEQFFTRLAHANVLSASAPVVPDFIPTAAGVEEPGDVVPLLRGDLIITASKASRGTLEVKDPLTERSFTLYDFEVSIARMLDGKRSAAEVLAAANRLGIPVSLPTLKTFLQQLRAYQFIDLKTGGGDSTWPRRKQWSVGVRELYQSALRLMRTGKYRRGPRLRRRDGRSRPVERRRDRAAPPDHRGGRGLLRAQRALRHAAHADRR